MAERDPDPTPAVSAASVGGGRRGGGRRLDVGGALVAVAGIAAFFAVWTAAAAVMLPSRLVSPLAAARDLVANFVFSPRLDVFGLGDAGYGLLTLYTLSNVLIGLTVGAAIGILLGVASAFIRPLRAAIDPIVLVMGTVPVLVAAPLFLLWFGVVPFTQVLLVAFYSAVMMVLFSQKAVENLDPIYERSAMTFGASLARRLRHILIPGAIPEILGGLRITLASAWGLEVFAEILGAPSGIGQAIKALTNLNSVSGLLACVAIVAIAAIATDALLLVIAGRITRWAR
jgi:ABC-type nitrate/sulfonate/bicarbonate transport system permease component